MSPPNPPNNLAATLLLALGLISVPAGLGIFLLIAGLALLKEADGQWSHARLHGLLADFQRVLLRHRITVWISSATLSHLARRRD